MSSNIVTKILLNEALQDKITAESDEEEIYECIDNIIIDENKKISKEKDIQETNINKKNIKISKLNDEVTNLKKSLEKNEKNERIFSDLVTKLENDKDRRDEKIDKLLENIQELTKKYNQSLDDNNKIKAVNDFKHSFIIYPANTIIFIAIIGYNLIFINYNKINAYFIMTAFLFSIVFIFLVRIKKGGEKNQFIKNNISFMKFLKKYKGFTIIIGFLFSGILIKPLLKLLAKVPILASLINDWFK